MKVKKDLAARIVTDFHSADVAHDAADNWEKMFQRDEIPDEIEEITLEPADVAANKESTKDKFVLKLDKLLAKSGLADSVSDGLRKIKQKAVRIDGEVRSEPVFEMQGQSELTVRVGRKIKKIRLRF
jgi:tyrosyl-tRNA synthetase